MNWYLKVVKENYINFKGRARRKEYWIYGLIHSAILILLLMLDKILGLTFTSEIEGWDGEMIILDSGYGYLTSIYLISTILPSIGVTIRRLHDIGKSAWFILINFIPFFGSIYFLIVMIKDSQKDENKYGTSPKYSEN